MATGWFTTLRQLTPRRMAGELQLGSPFAPSPSHLERWVWADLYGDTSLLPITRAEAMSVAPLARARHLICGTAARLPMHAYRGPELVTDPAPPWLDRTDRPTSPYHRMLWTFDDLLFEGWSLWLLDRGSRGEVLAAERIPSELWSFDDAGLILLGGEYPRDPSQLCLIPGPHEGLLAFAKRTIRHASSLVTAADRAAETPTPNIELHQTNDAKMTDDQIRELVAAWAKARRGANGGVAFTSNGVEVKTHGHHSENLLIEGRNAAAVDIARACGIPATMIDASLTQGSMSYANVAARNREFIDYGLAPYLAAVSARLGMDDVSPRGQRIAFDVEQYLAETVPGPYSTQDDERGTGSTPTSSTPPTSSSTSNSDADAETVGA